MIAQRQCETMKHINGQITMMKPQANTQAINILLEMNKIQQESEKKLANLLQKHLESQNQNQAGRQNSKSQSLTPVATSENSG